MKKNALLCPRKNQDKRLLKETRRGNLCEKDLRVLTVEAEVTQTGEATRDLTRVADPIQTATLEMTILTIPGADTKQSTKIGGRPKLPTNMKRRWVLCDEKSSNSNQTVKVISKTSHEMLDGEMAKIDADRM